MIKRTSAEDCKSILNVSRETIEKFKLFLELLEKWQKKINLVGKSTLLDPWKRHIIDCGQITRLIQPKCSMVLDLGTGAGLPGIILSIMGVKNVQLVESDHKKAAFLQEASRLCKISTKITVKRVENLQNMRANYVVARAFAPMEKALLAAKNQINKETKFVLHKGNNAINEIEEVKKKLRQESYLNQNLIPVFKIVKSKTEINSKIVICTFKTPKV